MPELPEVETTKRGISPFLINQKITAIVIRQTKLRREIPPELSANCIGKTILTIKRRAKYLLLELSEGYLLNHLGMSGHLRIVDKDTTASKHDHLDLVLSNGYILRYNDPRRFGLWLYIAANPEQHSLLCHLGLEPLNPDFNGTYLFQRARSKNTNIKSFIMDNKIVVGVGNIYATESLFLSRIHPLTSAKNLQYEQFENLVQQIKKVLQLAIKAGGTTLRDFYSSEGKPGYFSDQLQIYGRKGQPCFKCKILIQSVLIAGRSSPFCPNCQLRQEN